ncbi:Rpn family recombination-promoting nuclease/putative transposase, partial [Crocosphaera sp.]|uniref:Rpn family recombination-promoting nuclease/putative transposase n=1 Tax=Crocosphaera sp. TaxID=2729996 RepID=UPI003F2192D2
YRELLKTERVRRFYLDELSKIESVGIKTLKLIVEPETEAIEQGRQLIEQIRQQLTDARQQQEILQLIETILIYKLPKMNRQEIEAMFTLSDLRETKVYQEALEEGIEQGRMQEKLESIPRLLALDLSVEQIAQALALRVEQVQQVIDRKTE